MLPIFWFNTELYLVFKLISAPKKFRKQSTGFCFFFLRNLIFFAYVSFWLCLIHSELYMHFYKPLRLLYTSNWSGIAGQILSAQKCLMCFPSETPSSCEMPNDREFYHKVLRLGSTKHSILSWAIQNDVSLTLLLGIALLFPVAFHYTYASIYFGTKLMWKVQFWGFFLFFYKFFVLVLQEQRPCAKVCNKERPDWGIFLWEAWRRYEEGRGFLLLTCVGGIHTLQVKVRAFLLSQQKESHKVTLAQH